jgi:hypothetical protein
MIDVHLAFPGADDLPVVRLPAVPRIGECLYWEGRAGRWRVADVEWDATNGTALLDLRPEASDG